MIKWKESGRSISLQDKGLCVVAEGEDFGKVEDEAQCHCRFHGAHVAHLVTDYPYNHQIGANTSKNKDHNIISALFSVP